MKHLTIGVFVQVDGGEIWFILVRGYYMILALEGDMHSLGGGVVRRRGHVSDCWFACWIHQAYSELELSSLEGPSAPEFY